MRGPLCERNREPHRITLPISVECRDSWCHYPPGEGYVIERPGPRRAAGCLSIPSFAVVGHCTGFLHALAVGNQFIATGTCRNVLVVGSDVLSRTIDYTDRATCILFGDGAGAAILSPTENQERGVRWLQL